MRSVFVFHSSFFCSTSQAVRSAAVIAFLALSGFLAGCMSARQAESRRSWPPVALGFHEQNFARALARYSEGLMLENSLGRDSEEVLLKFADASTYDPESHRLLSRVAVIALQQGKPGVAISTLEDACKANPDDLQARVDLADVYHFSGHPAEAERNYRIAMRRKPVAPPLYLKLGAALLQQKKDSEALKVLEDGAAIPEALPGILAFCFNHGREFIDTKQVERSVPLFHFMASHAPVERARFYCLVGELYVELGQTDGARENFEKAIEQEQTFPEAFVQLADLQFDLASDGLDAGRTLARGLERFPDSSAILFAMAYLHHVQGRHDEAIPLLARVMDTVGKADDGKLSSGFFLLYGSVYERTGRIEEAEKIFLEGIAAYPDAHQMLNYLAYMWAEKNLHLDEGLGYVRKALQLEPENGAYIDTLGWIYFRQGKLDEALEQVEKADRLMPGDPTIKEHLGDIHHARGDTAHAVEFWKASFAIDPENAAVRGKLETQGIDVKSIPRKEPAAEIPNTGG